MFRHCAFTHAKHATWTQDVILSIWRTSTLHAWFQVYTQFHTPQCSQIAPRSRSAALPVAACDVSRQQEQRHAQGCSQSRYQVAGQNKSIMWSRGSILRPVPRGPHPKLEICQVQTARRQGIVLGEKKKKIYVYIYIGVTGCQMTT